MEKGKKEFTELEAQALLAKVLNDTPTEIDVDGRKYYISALKLGTMNLIAEESVKIQREQEGNMLDLYKQFAQCIPAVIKCLCYAILNDKNKIFKNYATKEYSEEYLALYEDIEWCSDRSTWMSALVEIMQRLDLDFFYQATSMLTILRQSALKTRKMTAERS